MHRIVVSFLALFLVTFGAGRARAEKMQTIPHAEAKVAIDVPITWAKKLVDHTLLMVEPSGAAIVGIKVLEGADLKAALAELDKDLGELVGGTSWEKPVQRDVHGMAGLTIDGKGTSKDGNAVNLMVAIVKSPSGKLVLTVVIASSAKLQGLAKDLKSILGSLRPLK